jgi:hypothetical protein
VVEVWEREVRAAWARKVVRELCRVVVGLGGGGEVAVVVGGSGGLVSSCEFVVRSGGRGEVVEEDWVEERHRCWAGRRSGGQRSGVVRLGLWQHFVRERASIKEPCLLAFAVAGVVDLKLDSGLQESLGLLQGRTA